MIERYEIIEANQDGTGYVVFYFSDGTSCGQQLTGAPVEDKSEFDQFIAAQMEGVEARAKTSAEKNVAPELVAEALANRTRLDAAAALSRNEEGRP